MNNVWDLLKYLYVDPPLCLETDRIVEKITFLPTNQSRQTKANTPSIKGISDNMWAESDHITLQSDNCGLKKPMYKKWTNIMNTYII